MRFLGTAECAQDAFVRRGRMSVIRHLWLIFVGFCQYGDQFFERTELARQSGLDGLLNAVITRDEGRVDGIHGRSARSAVLVFLAESVPPFGSPLVLGGGIGELIADTGIFGRVSGGRSEMAECVGEVGLIGGHRR